MKGVKRYTRKWDARNNDKFSVRTRDQVMSFRDISIDLIDPNPYQTRTVFDEESIAGLAESIKTVGLLNRVLLRPHPDDTTRFELVHGERRLRACKKLEWKTIPAIIRDLSDTQVAEINLIENLQRKDLNPLDEAQSFSRIIDKFGYSLNALAKRIGKSRPYVSNSLRLLDLPFFLRASVLYKTISPWHARTIMGLPEGFLKYLLADLVMDWGLSVEETREIVNDVKAGKRWVSWVRDVPVSGLVEYVSKERSFSTYKELINSMRENGLLEPIHILVTGVILDGSGRTNAARILSWKKINARVYFSTDWYKQDPGSTVQSSQTKMELPSPPSIVPELSEGQKKNMKRFVEMLRCCETVEERDE